MVSNGADKRGTEVRTDGRSSFHARTLEQRIFRPSRVALRIREEIPVARDGLPRTRLAKRTTRRTSDKKEGHTS